MCQYVRLTESIITLITIVGNLRDFRLCPLVVTTVAMSLFVSEVDMTYNIVHNLDKNCEFQMKLKNSKC